MCGIVGVINPKVGLSSSLPIIYSMMDVIAHRGPDDKGIYYNDAFVFGHQRLSIIDIKHGHQPFLSPDERYVIIFNGEIYNYLELRQKLKTKGVCFKTNTDTEVLLQMLITEGVDCLSRLNGMFAFAFYDRHEKKYLLARDHFGIKPLYYINSGSQVIFASEIKALLKHPEVVAKVNLRGLQHYLSLQLMLGDETLFSDIKTLEPASYIWIHNESVSAPKKYWKLTHEVDLDTSEEIFNTKLQNLLQDSVKIQCRSDAPLGAYLSGGLDSSIITSLAANDTIESLPTFSGKFSESNAYDESFYAKKVADNIDSELFFVEPTEDDFINLLPTLIKALDQPVAGPGVFPQFMVSQLASQHVKVVLGGQGGDEIFGGYARYVIAYLEQALKGAIFETQEEGKHIVTLNSLIPNLSILKRYKPLMQNFWSQGLFSPMDERYFHMIDRSPDMLTLLSSDSLNEFKKETVFGDFQQIFHETPTKSYINKMTYFDMKTLLPALLQIEDRVSMAHSLEARVPLLDYRIIELIETMPPNLKFKGGRTKYILKQAAKPWLPKEILQRKDKMGFPVPLDIWWKKNGKLTAFVKDILLSRASKERGLFSFNKLEAYLNNTDFDRQLWGVLCLELWHQIFIDR